MEDHIPEVRELLDEVAEDYSFSMKQVKISSVFLKCFRKFKIVFFHSKTHSPPHTPLHHTRTPLRHTPPHTSTLLTLGRKLFVSILDRLSHSSQATITLTTEKGSTCKQPNHCAFVLSCQKTEEAHKLFLLHTIALVVAQNQSNNKYQTTRTP